MLSTAARAIVLPTDGPVFFHPISISQNKCLGNTDYNFADLLTFAVMEFTKTYIVNDEHIDFQNIMDGLYYPFYMEYCRHDYIREALGFDFIAEAKNGVNMVLSK